MREERDGSDPECLRAARAIEDLGDSRMGAARWMLLRRHVKGCEECGTRYARMNTVLGALARMERARAPEGFATLVMERLADSLDVKASAEPGRDNRNLVIVAGAAGLTLVVGLTLALVRHLLGRHDDDELAIATHAWTAPSQEIP